MKFYIYFTISAVNACVCVSDWNPCTLYAQPKVDGIMHLLLFAAEGQLFECTNIRSLKSCTYLVRPIYVEHPHIMSYWITPTHRAECDRTRLCYLCVPSTCVRMFVRALHNNTASLACLRIDFPFWVNHRRRDASASLRDNGIQNKRPTQSVCA